MMILGVDPGAKGAFAVLDGDSVIVEPMPLDQNDQLDLNELNRLLRYYADHVTYAYLEQAQIRMMQAGTFSFIRNFGILEGMLACLGIKTIVVTAQKWSAEFDHGVTDKAVTKKEKALRQKKIKIARKKITSDLYPGIDLKRTPQCKFADEGICDALLIATYGWRKHGKTKG